MGDEVQRWSSAKRLLALAQIPEFAGQGGYLGREWIVKLAFPRIELGAGPAPVERGLNQPSLPGVGVNVIQRCLHGFAGL